MGTPGIQVILACPCMNDDGSGIIDWIPGEYEAIPLEHALVLLARHVKSHETHPRC